MEDNNKWSQLRLKKIDELASLFRDNPELKELELSDSKLRHFKLKLIREEAQAQAKKEKSKYSDKEIETIHYALTAVVAASKNAKSVDPTLMATIKTLELILKEDK